ncbi:ABC transporter substrate-binding protein [Paenibacillus beijingensis]|uniref:ABC transporter substrate-binding protein n=1 Tax=Paenibacillus beijingensis TaxID=1126833 RepID=A0A0D5NMG9_9BACL|nr:extracellular solute-binding protein [Paenibacillus beijingensis]AJY76172.1 hypothetical protein VN24_18410 [Paenibacillus beijingensis]
MLKRERLLAIGLMMTAAVVSACRGGGGDEASLSGDKSSQVKETLTVWVNRPDPLYEKTANEIAEEMNVSLKYELTNGDDLYTTKLKTAIVANELPDVYMQDAGLSDRSMLLTSKSAAPLNDTLKQLGAESKYYKGQLTKDKDGTIYSLPYRPDTGYVLLYNKKLMAKLGKQPPKTYDDLLNISEAALANRLLPIALGNKDRWPGDLLYNMLVLRQDTEAYAKAAKGEMKFTDKPFVQAAEQIIELVRLGAFGNEVLANGDQEVMNMFYSGKAVFYPTGSWVFFSGAIEHLKNDLGFAIFPKTGPVDDLYLSSLSNHNDEAPYALFVNPSSKRLAEAKEFAVRFSLQLNDVQVKSGQIPYAQTEAKPEGPISKSFSEFVGYTLKLKGTQTFWFDVLPREKGERFRDLTQKLYTGDLSAADFTLQLEAVMRK